MDFHLTKEQLMLRKMYREFAENEVKPLAEEIDEEERFPMETVEKMAKKMAQKDRLHHEKYTKFLAIFHGLYYDTKRVRRQLRSEVRRKNA